VLFHYYFYALAWADPEEDMVQDSQGTEVRASVT